MNNNFKLEDLLSILQRASGNFEPSSDEYFSIELSAKAILFIHATGQQNAFQAYMMEIKRDLTEKERSFLNSLGLT